LKPITSGLPSPFTSTTSWTKLVGKVSVVPDLSGKNVPGVPHWSAYTGGDTTSWWPSPLRSTPSVSDGGPVCANATAEPLSRPHVFSPGCSNSRPNGEAVTMAMSGRVT